MRLPHSPFRKAGTHVPGPARARPFDPQDRVVETEQIRLFYKASGQTPYALLVLLTVLALFISEHVPAPWPYVWALMVAAVYVARGMMTRWALARNLDDEALRRHCRFVYALTT